MSQVIGLFSTPLMRAQRLLPPTLVAALAGWALEKATNTNARSDRLSHSEIVTPAPDDVFGEARTLIGPLLPEFGELLFGESLPWAVKEMWVNVLETGGRQAMHNHANSFISGIAYLSEPHPSASTVFIKGMGGTDFVFNNTNARARLGPFNAGKWVMPEASPGDVVLFPSYLLHEVPVNEGGRRISLAFNAVPRHLDSWGYSIRFE